MTFGQRVRKYRELRQMSQDELAKRAGYAGRSAISKIEQGDRNVSQGTIYKLAKALGVQPDALLFDYTDEEEDPEEMEKNMVWNSYSQLNESQKRAVFMMIQTMLGVEK